MAHPAPPATSPEAIEAFREAGRIAARARQLGAGMIKPGNSLREVIESVEAYIYSQDAIPAFPAQTSRNHIAAHYCPSPTDATVYEPEDVVKIDIGVAVDGYVADNAQTVYLGEDPGRQQLVEASKLALQAAIDTAGPGVRVSEISTAIERAINGQGFRPVYNLTGHGVARWRVHTAPQIPPSPDKHSNTELAAGMVVAIEPFATDGEGHVHEKGRAEVFMVVRQPRKMKGIEEEAWHVIEAMNGLPFARRTFGDLPREKVESSLARLLRTGCITAFPPLVDPDPGVRISQHEHTLMIVDDGVEVITADPDTAESAV